MTTQTQTTLDAFTRACIECAPWSSNDESNESGGEPLDKNYNASDIAPEALARIIADCTKFQAHNAALLENAYTDASLPVNGSGERYGGAASAGHDFWLTRNGHGAGFWDGDWDSVDNDGAEYGDRLTEAAKSFGECTLYVGDDGQLYLA